MQVKLGHNGLDRVPSRAKLVPTVTTWRRMSQPQTPSEPRSDGHCEQKPKVVGALIVADDSPVVVLAPVQSISIPSELTVKPSADWLARLHRPPTPWAGEDKELIEWFRSHRDRLPTEPFQLFAWADVCNPATFFKALEGDIRGGSNGPRAVGLRSELCRLREMF